MLLAFFENFYGAGYIFPVTSPVSKTFVYLELVFLRALRHLQVPV